MQQNWNLNTQMASFFDISAMVAGNLFDYFQALLSATHPPMGRAEELVDDPKSYDPKSRSWLGDGGLRYRVPVTTLPSESHTRYKMRNIKILMDNIRRLSVNDELPGTPEERRFWTMYGFYKQQMFLSALGMILPPIYLFCKMAHTKLPQVMRGRLPPVVVSLAIAEQVSESWYPGHQFLCTALQAKTPLGDAARADWQRLQPVVITYQAYAGYQFKYMLNKVNKEFMLGGDIKKALKD